MFGPPPCHMWNRAQLASCTNQLKGLHALPRGKYVLPHLSVEVQTNVTIFPKC